MATRIYNRSSQVTDGSRSYGSSCWVVERDVPGKPGTVEFVRCGSEAQALRELGDETPSNMPWRLAGSRKRSSRTRWAL